MSIKSALQSNDPRLPEIVERLRAGSALIAESRKLGYTHNGPLRAALRELLGKDNYDTMMMSPARVSSPEAASQA